MAELQAQQQSAESSSELKMELEELTAQLHSEQDVNCKLVESNQTLKQVRVPVHCYAPRSYQYSAMYPDHTSIVLCTQIIPV